MNTATKISTVVLLLASALTAACQPQKIEPPPDEITVQLLWTHQSQFAGFYAADQKGFYADEGLAITFIEGGPGVDRWTSMLDGKDQFGVAGGGELIIGRSEGKPVRAIATIYRRSPVVFISLEDAGITRPEDIAGKQIRASENTVPSLNAIMAQVGVSPDQYTIVADLPSDLGLFVTGEVPVWGVYLTSFLITAQEAGYTLNIIYPDDYGVHFYADTIFTTDDIIANDPELVQRFLNATLKGWKYVVENPGEIPAMVKKVQPSIDASLESKRINSSLPLINTGEDYIGWMNTEIWAGMEHTLREQGLITTPLDITQVYTQQFLKEIYDQ
ncbi:MAG: ABC transporter substrate-binding protein [Anaerolineaceae bacterium]|nr:ABC transporter substrate-binding protein [Anaerolineaceae bacterium]